jgi:hypothetical protein
MISPKLVPYLASRVPCQVIKNGMLEIADAHERVASVRALFPQLSQESTNSWFFDWPKWDDIPEPLPGTEDRLAYAHKLLWPGPPPSDKDPSSLKLVERRRHHRAFYYPDTG